MEKYKLYPNCKHINKASSGECEKCSWSLDNVVAMTLKQIEQQQAADQVEQKTKTKQSVKCDNCGTENTYPVLENKCKKCRGDIPDDLNTANTETDEKGIFTLCSLEDSFTFTLAKPETIIGRGHEMSDYLINKKYVGRKQAKITINGGKAYIEDISKTNPTFVNGNKITKGITHLLHNEDEISLGGCVIN